MADKKNRRVHIKHRRKLLNGHYTVQTISTTRVDRILQKSKQILNTFNVNQMFNRMNECTSKDSGKYSK